jgi:uncharacterized 2Fe-2S/4Fe-4S cluster protein (DUF4445 family)
MEIKFQLEGGGEVSIFATQGENLLALARKANVAIDAPCSGNFSCGKCGVRLLSGELTSEATVHIDKAPFKEGWRLACASSVCGDATIMVPDIASAYRGRMKVADLSSTEDMAVFSSLQAAMEEGGLTKGSGVRSFHVHMEAPTLADTMPDNERLSRALRAATGAAKVELSYSVLKKVPLLLRENEFELRCISQSRADALEVLDLLPGADTLPACGLAIDIGTTTVSGLLVDMETGVILAKASTGNGQIRYGADVIHRIVEQQKTGGIDRLQRAIVGETLLPLIDTLCHGAGISKERIYRVTVASNTTMNHLLLGVDANALRTEPYVPAFLEIDCLSTQDLGIELAPVAKVFLAPNIGSYVGGDITAGALAYMMWNRPELSMLIDLGTNGEIVFGNNEFLMGCACSAGPAFEGGDISCGMRAIDGAIEAFSIDHETMKPSFSVIGGVSPVGICGSGLIDVVAELFRAGIVNGKGKIVREGERVRSDEYGIASFILVSAKESENGREVVITEVDIDNFIRAKGAIYAAVSVLLDSLGFSPTDIEQVAVAGGIGSGINFANAIRVGMFADLPLERYRYIGNSSLAGAYATLVSEKAAVRLREVSRRMTYLELSVQPGYMDAFVAGSFLPHTNCELFPSAKVEWKDAWSRVGTQ